MSFETLINVIERPEVAALFPRIADPDPSGGPQVWRTYPRYSEMLASAKAEANGAASWARWADGTAGGDSQLQVDVALAVVAEFVPGA